MSRWATDPVGFCRDVLHVGLTDQQRAIAPALLDAPYRVLVDSAHNVGKTFLAACLTLWWYWTRNPSVVITTAPTYRDVVDLLWTEIRLLNARAGLPDHFVGPRAPEFGSGPQHWAKGYTARKGESFQGRHRAAMLFIFDEAEGVDPTYWTTTRTMFQPTGKHAWLAIGNPTTTSSAAYLESLAKDQTGGPSWHRFSLSALDHPNVTAALAGAPPAVPSAVSLEQVRGWIDDWCLPVPAAEACALDFEWPPGSARWWRPGPIAEPRLLGRRPSAGTCSVWSDLLFGTAETRELEPALTDVPQLGVDVARFGDDFTAIHVRAGPVSLHHESANGWDTTRTAARVRELCAEWAAWHNARRPAGAEPVRPQALRIKIDGDPGSGGVQDQLKGYNTVAVPAGGRPNNQEAYPNRRSELWFDTAYRAKVGRLSLARLSESARGTLRVQALAPEYFVDAADRRVVDPKDVTKQVLGRSPDDMDAMNLAYCDAGLVGPIEGVPRQRRTLAPEKYTAAARRGLWGRRG